MTCHPFHNSQLICFVQAEKPKRHSRVALSTRSRRFSVTSRNPSTPNSPSLPMTPGNCPKSLKRMSWKLIVCSATSEASVAITKQRERPIPVEADRLPSVPEMPAGHYVIEWERCAFGFFSLYFLPFQAIP